MEIKDQMPIEAELPLICVDNIEGYDLGALIDLALEVYDLDSQFGIQVDYWSNSLQSYLICDNLFSHRSSIQSKNSRNSAASQNQRHIICEEDLTVSREGKPCLLVRFKNCTGNIIALEDVQQNVTENELA